MAIEQSKYLPKQMNGPVINSVMAGLEQRLEDAQTIQEYLYNLSIDTAQETELESIGCLVGYPRPLVPEGFALDNIFIFTTAPSVIQTDIGFSAVESEVGGRFVSITPSDTNYMSLGLYRQFLSRVAFIKRYGVTLYSVDQIAKLVDSEYTITWDENKDIELNFTNSIGFQNLWILSSLFYRLATSPQVNVTTSTE